MTRAITPNDHWALLHAVGMLNSGILHIRGLVSAIGSEIKSFFHFSIYVLGVIAPR